MIKYSSWMRQVTTLVILAGVSTSCASKSLTLERDRLKVENKDLRAALESAENNDATSLAERDRLATEVSRLQSELASKPAPVVVASNTGFDMIKGVEVEHARGMIKVKVPGDVLFDAGRVTLRKTSKRTLDQIAHVIRSQYDQSTIGIEGHTDADPIKKSKWTDNLELSVQRAAAVHRYLRSNGIKATKMYAAGWGETHPRSTKAKSRRVEIVVLTG